MGFNPVKEAKKAAQKEAKKVVGSVIKPAAEAATKAADKAIWKCRRAAWAAVEKIRDQSIRDVKKVGDGIKDGLTDDLPDLIEDAAEKIAREASEKSIEEVLDNAADVIEILAPDSFTLVFGIELALVVQGEVTVSFTFPNPTAKLTEIRKWADKPPKGRAKIIECIKDFGPESLGAEFKVSGNGIGAEWSGESKYDRIDAFLEKHGVS